MPYKDKEKERQRNRERSNSPEYKAYQRQYRKDKRNDPSWIRLEKGRSLRHLYKMSIEDHDIMRQAQNNRCAVCKEPFVGYPHVDHDHSCCPGIRSCGKCVRELICGDCNRALGIFQDDIIRLESAIEYLKRHKDKNELHEATGKRV